MTTQAVLVYTEALLILQYGMLALSRCVCGVMPSGGGHDDTGGGCIQLLASPEAQRRCGACACAGMGVYAPAWACSRHLQLHAAWPWHAIMGLANKAPAPAPPTRLRPCHMSNACRLRVIGLHSSALQSVPLFLAYLSCLVYSNALDRRRMDGGAGTRAASHAGAPGPLALCVAYAWQLRPAAWRRLHAQSGACLAPFGRAACPCAPPTTLAASRKIASRLDASNSSVESIRALSMAGLL